MQQNLKVGFVGLGIMGKPMAMNVLKAGFALSVYNRTKAKADEVVAAGATWCDSPKAVAQNSDVIITIVSDTPDVEQVLFGQEGVAQGAKQGAVVIDMSTISPQATREFAVRLREEGVDMLDCPVSGGDIGAIKGTLTIMCGGEQSVFDACRPVLEAMGTKVTLMGQNGAGQATKLCNQIALGNALLGVCECLMMASKEGLDCDRVIEVLSGGAANSMQLSNRGPLIVKRDYSAGFFVDLFQKDLRLVMQAVQADHLSLPGISTVQQLYNVVQGIEGSHDMGSQALILALEQLCNHKVGEKA